MLINLWVRDNFTGEVHQVGTDQHDSIDFMDGQAHYYNMQNGCGTLDNGEGGYTFIEAPDIDGYISITPEELYLNEAYVDERLYRFMKKHKKNKKKEEHKKAVARYNRKIYLTVKKIRKKIGIIFR